MTTPPDYNADELNFGETVRGLNSETVLFERFRTKRVLGRGGMGVVWLAQDEKLGRLVALKFLPDMIALDTASLTDLRKETRNGLLLSHPNLIRMLDLVEEGPSAAIVMEFVDGKTLSDLRVLQPNLVFETAVLAPWISQLTGALHYAHSEVKMVHRDLKPQNLMVNTADQLKVADFGIASCLRDSMSRVSARANSAGTLVYMSPQQLMGEIPKISDDIYSFGATLFELLTGKPPFYAGDIPKQIETKAPPSVAERRREFGIDGDPIPPAWEAVIGACLEKDPRNRPAGMAEIQKGLDGQPFKRGSGETGFTTRRNPAGGGKIPAWLPAAAVIAVGLGALWHWGFQLPREEARLAAQAEKQEAEEQQARRWRAADEELKTFREDFERLSTEIVGATTTEKFDTWTRFKSALSDFSAPADYSRADQVRNLLEEVDGTLTALKRKMEREQGGYTATLEQLKEDFKTLRAECAKADMGAAPKLALVEKFLQEWPAKKLGSDYGEDHETLLSDANALEKDMREKAAAETPAAPLSQEDCLKSSKVRNWAAYGLTRTLLRVEEVLSAQEYGLASKPDGKYDSSTGAAIIAYQKYHNLPAHGRLDDLTFSRMAVDISTEPKQTASAVASSARKPSSGSGSSGGSRPRSSGSGSGSSSSNSAPSRSWMDYIPNRGGPSPGGFRPPFGGGVPLPFR